MIAIASFGVGNVRALANIYERQGVPVTIATSPNEIKSASHVILPGVGAFDWAMQKLKSSGLSEALNEAAVVDRRPVLGICVGMQMMVERSDEGTDPGLGWIGGDVRQFAKTHDGHPLPLPHMGWNDIQMNGDPLFAGLAPGTPFYFLHSYYVNPRIAETTIATAEYGVAFTCAIRAQNLVGVQFHPEKSHQSGERILLNFAAQS